MKDPEERHEVLARFLAGPDLLERALAGVGADVLDRRPRAGGWTIRQIVHHLVDGDLIWSSCIKMALGDEGAVFRLDWYTAHSQDRWAEIWAYARRPLPAALALFRAGRDSLAGLLEQAPEAWTRAATVASKDGEQERISVGFVVAMQADHLEHHLRRIGELLREAAGE